MRTAILFLSVSSALFAQSPRALLGWGAETDPSDAASRAMGEAGEALRSDRAWDPRLEARSAFASLTALEVQVSPTLYMISDSKSSNTATGGGIPRVSLSVPMGRFGHLGLGYFQRFDKAFGWSSPLDSSISASGQGGAFEGVVSYGYALPWLRGLALGATYHRILGADRLLVDDVFQAADEGLATTYSDTLEHTYWGSYWTGSVYFTRGRFDVGAWADFAGSVRVETTSGGTYQQTAPLATGDVDPPRSIGLATGYRYATRQAVVADLAWTTWNGAIHGASDRWKGGLGWQTSATGDRFDDFWKRVSWRAGAYGIVGGPSDLLTEAATAGMGMPLGDLGTLDLSLQLGQNQVDNGGPKLKDSFVGLYVTVTGANSWGQSLRSHR